MRAYARRRIGRSAADDTVSEVFATAWRRLEDVPADALPWLLACARLVVAHQRRRARRDSALVGRLEANASVPITSDRTLAQALAELSETDRELLLLIAWEGLEPAQAAKTLGCSRNALAVRLHRARKRLAAALAHADNSDLARNARRPAEEAL